MDEGDKDEADTATREAHEEIGLDPALINVVTCLEPFLSKVSFWKLQMLIYNLVRAHSTIYGDIKLIVNESGQLSNRVNYYQLHSRKNNLVPTGI